jgi:hypothetical protein
MKWNEIDNLDLYNLCGEKERGKYRKMRENLGRV